MSLSTALQIAQIILAITLILVVILQMRGSNVPGVFGGGDSASVFSTRRGLEKTLFQATIVLAVIFVIVSIASVKFAG
ncbi:MAG: preprotein translocase subunit SecG [Chloroflexota bacterium]